MLRKSEYNGVFDLPNWIQWNCPFSARIRICESSESSFDADSLAKPEMLSSKTTSHQHHQRKQTTMTFHWTTPTNPDRSICQWIQIRIHYETESRFGKIEYGFGFAHWMDGFTESNPNMYSANRILDRRHGRTRFRLTRITKYILQHADIMNVLTKLQHANESTGINNYYLLQAVQPHRKQ